MAAFVQVVEKEHWKIVHQYLAALGEGGVLLSPAAAESLTKRIGCTKEELNDLFLDSYDFGGQPDLYVDVVWRGDTEHMASQAILEHYAEAGADTLGEQDAGDDDVGDAVGV